MKPQRRTFADVVARFLEKPFSPGGKGGSYDCLGFVYAFLCALGKGDKLNTSFGALDIDNYHCAYPNMTQTEIRDRLIEIWEANGREIPVGKQLAGDAVIVEIDGNKWFPAIWAGSGHMLSSFTDAGVRAVRVKDNMRIIKVRRVD